MGLLSTIPPAMAAFWMSSHWPSPWSCAGGDLIRVQVAHVVVIRSTLTGRIFGLAVSAISFALSIRSRVKGLEEPRA